MIYLVTGLPGHGKTYFTIAKAIEIIGTSGRPVFYSGIPDLKLDWTESDPKRWPELQDGSVMVIDEAQRIFPVPPVGAPRGLHVTALETHRHKGLDLWLITQDANLLDSHVRRLVGVHYHVQRPFGMPFVNVLQWDGVHNPRDYHDKQKAVTSKFRLTSKVWNLYKSATVHTVRARIPWKMVALLLGIVAVPFLGYLVWQILGTMGKGAKKPSEMVAGVSPPGGKNGAPIPPPVGSLRPSPSASPADYVAQFAPRMEGLAWTAPRYDEMTRPQVTPAITMCFAIWDRESPVCECKAQNGAALPVDGEWCLAVIKRGLPFRDFATFTGVAPTVGEAQRPAQVGKGAPGAIRPDVAESARPLQTAPVPLFGASAMGTAGQN